MFNCTVVGDPLPSISWYFSGDVLSNKTMLMLPFDAEGRIVDDVLNTLSLNSTTIHSTTIHSSLNLDEIASYIAGNYTCKASNSLGSVNETAVLTVHGK